MARNFADPVRSLGKLCWLGAILAGIFAGSSLGEEPPPQAINTQNPADRPPSPQESLQRMRVPDGFRVTLFAGEPDVHQPIAFTFDDRGRLWVVENYSYPEWREDAHDRIVIFEDVDQDGRFDRRKIFLENGRHLTGIELGFGGVWCTASPYLIFIPDRDQDDRPDSAPTILLDGFNLQEVQHNVVNGLRWGPDGWLYGRHGIKATSRVGRPGDPRESRLALNCGIWRFHPQTHALEVVAHGTTNPWGFDYDDHGEMFFTNNVIGHLWHLVPGARYERMHPAHFNHHTYVEMPPASDHLHFAGGLWSKSRKEVGKPNLHDVQGGGHSHCGGMIYLGDNWPQEYRGAMFLCNTHGKRINMDRFYREGSAFLARHDEDFLFANDDWFRGVELKYGPDGGVYLSDWTDLGECHDRDGIHRRSGRIYKIVFGETPELSPFNLSKQSDIALLDLQHHQNDWYVRQSRRILQERTRGEAELARLRREIVERWTKSADVRTRLRYLWCLHSVGAETDWLMERLKSKHPACRAWAVRLLADRLAVTTEEGVESRVVNDLAALARRESSPLVRLYLASALTRTPEHVRWRLAAAVLSREEDADDPRIGALVWYGVEPLAVLDAERTLRLVHGGRFASLQVFLAKRLASDSIRSPHLLDSLCEFLSAIAENGTRPLTPYIAGMRDGLAGLRQVKPPASWKAVRAIVQKSKSPKLETLAREVDSVMGSGRALEELAAIVRDVTRPPIVRLRALESLVSARDPKAPALLQSLINDRAVRDAAVRGLAAFDTDSTPAVLLRRYGSTDRPIKEAIVDTLASRPAYARALLNAVADGRIPRDDISPSQARQLSNLGNREIGRLLESHWGSLQQASESQQKTIAQLKHQLGESLAMANLREGKKLFAKHCGNCHRLFGEGAAIGPDLTGSGRANLDYSLQNVVTPSAVVSADYRVSVVAMKDGRVLTGVLRSVSEDVQTLQTDKDTIRLLNRDIKAVRKSRLSLMPDNLLQDLTAEQIRDLFGYLASPSPVE